LVHAIGICLFWSDTLLGSASIRYVVLLYKLDECNTKRGEERKKPKILAGPTLPLPPSLSLAGPAPCPPSWAARPPSPRTPTAHQVVSPSPRARPTHGRSRAGPAPTPPRALVACARAPTRRRQHVGPTHQAAPPCSSSQTVPPHRRAPTSQGACHSPLPHLASRPNRPWRGRGSGTVPAQRRGGAPPAVRHRGSAWLANAWRSSAADRCGGPRPARVASAAARRPACMARAVASPGSARGAARGPSTATRSMPCAAACVASLRCAPSGP
jgi:hypothetical protein